MLRSDRKDATTGLPRNVTVRCGTPDDDYHAFEVMQRAMGFEANWRFHVRPRAHLNGSSGASFWVAEEKPRFGHPKIIGYSRSILRDGMWILTEFFVQPAQHRQGIGRALLTRCLQDGGGETARNRIVLASHHPAALSLYIRVLGCTPRVPMILMTGTLGTLRLPDDADAMISDTVLNFIFSSPERPKTFNYEPLRAEPLILTERVLAELNTLDRQVLGYTRPEEHFFWSREMGGSRGPSRLFRTVGRTLDGKETCGDLVGYTYMGVHYTGPALAVAPANLPRMVWHVAQITRWFSQSEGEFDMLLHSDQSFAVPGVNEHTVRWLNSCGWQTSYHYLYMSTMPAGNLEKYIGFSPIYLL